MCVEELFPEFQPYVAYFVEICHRLYSKGLVCAYDGNVSMKIGEHILITPTHVCKGDLSVSDLLVINGAGEKLYGKRQPSSEMKVHLAVYNTLPERKCVIHAHPVYTTAVYRHGKNVDVSLLTESEDTLGFVPVVPFAEPGSQALAEGVREVISGKIKICVLEKHGVVASGVDLEETYFLLESLERLAKTETIIATTK